MTSDRKRSIDLSIGSESIKKLNMDSSSKFDAKHDDPPQAQLENWRTVGLGIDVGECIYSFCIRTFKSGKSIPITSVR